jgi:energy-coupling factor transporter ATP-binding protein EcfA2
MTTPEVTAVPMAEPPASNGPTPPAPTPAPSSHDAVLRTLAPMLRHLERSVRAWLETKHIYPRDLVTGATLEGFANDLHRQAEALESEQPLLVVMLMGGTGVGKSTLLNALAGGAVAHASFARPTTKDPVVYYHESNKTDKLDPLLRTMRLASHDRPALQHKVLVDLPDLDSNVIEHRETARRLLPVADVVLYVGSQEKYHDKIGWDEFLQQRQRRAVAFVMNKWDRCLHAGAAGLRPDEDLERDLKSLGFEKPLIFRTNAQYWVDKANNEAREPEPPPGEQFLDLTNWLEAGLNRMEIEAIKARGITQLLDQLQKALEAAAPPDLIELAARTRSHWEKSINEEATATSDILLNTLEPYQGEIEHHFTVESQKHFRGLMAGYLALFAKAKYTVNNMAKSGISLLPRASTGDVDRPTTWDIGQFSHSLSTVAGERQLDARGKALANKLLLQAQDLGYPLNLLQQRTESAAQIDWRSRYAQALVEVLTEVERQWSRPTGLRRFLQTLIRILGNVVPPAAFLASAGLVVWHNTMDSNHRFEGWSELLMPVIVTLISLVAMQVLIQLVLPLRWPRIRGEFQGLLEQRLRQALLGGYAAIPVDLAEELRGERRKVEDLVKEVREVFAWLEQRQQSASVTGLYGK